MTAPSEPNPDEFPEVSPETWADLMNAHANADELGAMVEATVSASPIIDRASMWGAAGVGGAAGLTVAHIQAVVSTVGITETRVLFAALAGSLLCAVLQKAAATLVSTMLHVLEQTRERLADVQRKNLQNVGPIRELARQQGVDVLYIPSVAQAIARYKALFPRWFRRIYNERLKRIQKNPDLGYELAIRRYFWQLGFAVAQFLTIVAFTVLVAIFV